jgi:hypothetical protein
MSRVAKATLAHEQRQGATVSRAWPGPKVLRSPGRTPSELRRVKRDDHRTWERLLPFAPSARVDLCLDDEESRRVPPGLRVLIPGHPKLSLPPGRLAARRQAYECFDPENQRIWNSRRLTALAEQYRRNLGFEPEEVRVRSCQEDSS